MSIIFFSWLWGLSAFLSHLPADYDASENVKYDAVIVYTGGEGRITEALKLFADENANYLFISGVGVNTTKDMIISMAKEGENISPDKVKCCLHLDKISENTHENALNTAKWLKDKEIEAIILVTADYHMPRALFETDKALKNIKIIPYSLNKIFTGKNRVQILFLLISEYHKFSYVVLKDKIENHLDFTKYITMPEIGFRRLFK